MPYLGVQPTDTFASVAKQTITGDGSVTYTLTHSVANANDLAVFVNNVRQEPTVAYSASGTSITFTEAIDSTDDCYVVYIARTFQTVTAPDNSITADQLSYPLTNFSSTGIDDNATSTAITIDSSENVGIGGSPTSSSSYKTLNIIGGADVGGALRLSTTENENGHVFQYNDGIYLSGDEVTFISTGDPGVGGDVKTAYRVDRTAELHRWFNPLDGSTEAMRINDAGQLLIGTSSNALDGNISGVGTSSDFTVNGSVGKFQVANTGNLIAFSRNAANYISATGSASSLILDTPKTLIRSESGSEYARFDSDGLKFNGDTAAANALDDYEEGSFTPFYQTSNNDQSGITYSNQIGNYTKIGNVVRFNVYMQISGFTNLGTGSVHVGGFPFTNAQALQPFSLALFQINWDSTSYPNTPVGYFSSATTLMSILGMADNTGWGALNSSQFTWKVNGVIALQGTYITS